MDFLTDVVDLMSILFKPGTGELVEIDTCLVSDKILTFFCDHKVFLVEQMIGGKKTNFQCFYFQSFYH